MIKRHVSLNMRASLNVNTARVQLIWQGLFIGMPWIRAEAWRRLWCISDGYFSFQLAQFFPEWCRRILSLAHQWNLHTTWGAWWAHNISCLLPEKPPGLSFAIEYSQRQDSKRLKNNDSMIPLFLCTDHLERPKLVWDAIVFRAVEGATFWTSDVLENPLWCGRRVPLQTYAEELLSDHLFATEWCIKPFPTNFHWIQRFAWHITNIVPLQWRLACHGYQKVLLQTEACLLMFEDRSADP